MRYFFTLTSSNAKTGNIPQVYAQRSTCPPSCIHYGTTCYARSVRTDRNWRKADTGITLAELCDKISSLPRYSSGATRWPGKVRLGRPCVTSGSSPSRNVLPRRWGKAWGLPITKLGTFSNGEAIFQRKG